MTAKYYITAEMLRAKGACTTAYDVAGREEKQIPISPATVRAFLKSDLGHYLFWPGYNLPNRKTTADLKRITDRLDLIGMASDDVCEECTCRDCKAALKVRKEHFKNGRPSKAIVQEVVDLLNVVGDEYHLQEQENNRGSN